jgi:hypothetical protein
MPNRLLTPYSILQEFYPEAGEFVLGVMINVNDDFRVEPFQDEPHRSKPPRSVRHADTSGLPQFTVIEERVFGINEQRQVYRVF